MSVDYEKLYNLNIGESVDKKYEQYVKLYYSNMTQICPTCTNKDINRQKLDDGSLMMECGEPPCKWKVIIKMPYYINLYEKKQKSKLCAELSLYNMNKIIKNKMTSPQKDDNENFEKYKKEYIHCMNDVDSLDKLFLKENEYIDKYDKDNYELLHNINNLNIKRKIHYSNIKNKPTKNNMNKLITIYKTNENINDTKMKELSKSMSININDLKEIFEWLKSIKEYLIANNKFKSNINNINNIKNTCNNINKNFLISKPSYNETGTMPDMIIKNINLNPDITSSSKKSSDKKKSIKIKLKADSKDSKPSKISKTNNNITDKNTSTNNMVSSVSKEPIYKTIQLDNSIISNTDNIKKIKLNIDNPNNENDLNKIINNINSNNSNKIEKSNNSNKIEKSNNLNKIEKSNNSNKVEKSNNTGINALTEKINKITNTNSNNIKKIKLKIAKKK